MGNSIFKRYEYLENTYDLETTITSFSCNGDHFEIMCNPQYGEMKLRRDHPKFIELYSKLKTGSTHNFKCHNWIFNLDEIIDITDCKTHVVKDKIMGILDINNEIYILKNYNEIITTDIGKRLLICATMKENIVIGNMYEIKYTKKFGDNFYIVVEVNMV